MDVGTVEGEKFVFSASGRCCICGQPTVFRAERGNEIPLRWYKHWFRGDLKCTRCGSIPRERALFTVIERLYPMWRGLRIHESSPVYRGVSKKFQDECATYIRSQYDPDLGFGLVHPTRKYHSQDLESQTFDNASFDIVITQDVFEHLFAPDRAIQEISRTLVPGGAHIMTVPLVKGIEPSVRRACLRDGKIEHMLPAQYHGNPMSSEGSLVTIDWGYDILDYLAFHSGMAISHIQIDDLSQGISAVYCDVIVCKKVMPIAV